jgi:inner membrane protein
MASIGHIAIGMAVARALQPRSSRLAALLVAMVGWSLLALLPDIDVIGRSFGIRYGDSWGHRGASHSFAVCFGLAIAIGVAGGQLGAAPVRTSLCALVVLVSHPLLDILTDGGLGCALFWPFDDTRYFASWRPIPVAPLGRHYFTDAGLRVALRELALFFPFIVYALWPRRRAG